MDRKDFLKTCAGGLCACAAASFAPVEKAVADEAAKPEDKRLAFVKKRYAKFLEILSDETDGETLDAVLRRLGDYCASQGDEKMAKYRGDPDAYAENIKKGGAGNYVIYDPEKHLVTMSIAAGGECLCPLNGVAFKTPGVVCSCSLGWQQHVWEALLQKKVRVELKEAVLRGGKSCLFEIHVLDEPV